MTEYDSFAVRTGENVSGTFTLVDENEVVIEVPHPLKSQRSEERRVGKECRL